MKEVNFARAADEVRKFAKAYQSLMVVGEALESLAQKQNQAKEYEVRAGQAENQANALLDGAREEAEKVRQQADEIMSAARMDKSRAEKMLEDAEHEKRAMLEKAGEESRRLVAVAVERGKNRYKAAIQGLDDVEHTMAGRKEELDKLEKTIKQANQDLDEIRAVRERLVKLASG